MHLAYYMIIPLVDESFPRDYHRSDNHETYCTSGNLPATKLFAWTGPSLLALGKESHLVDLGISKKEYQARTPFSMSFGRHH